MHNNNLLDALRLQQERYRKMCTYFLGSRTDRDDAIVACKTQDELDTVIDNLEKLP